MRHVDGEKGKRLYWSAGRYGVQSCVAKWGKGEHNHLGLAGLLTAQNA